MTQPSGTAAKSTKGDFLLTGRSHGINKLTSRQRSVAAAILLTKQVGRTKSLCSQPISTALTPLIKVKTVTSLLLQRQHKLNQS